MFWRRVLQAPQIYRNLNRFRQILSVILGHGLVDVAQTAGLVSRWQAFRAWLPWTKEQDEARRLSREERIRLALEELGPTFVKLGQVLSTRPDLVPWSVVLELRKLQDRVPPFSGEEAKRLVEQELKAPIGKFFASFDEQPLAAASIAQVHRATLLDGTPVAVKVQRPNLDATIRADLDILAALAKYLDAEIPESRRFNPVGVAREFGRSIKKELNYLREAHNIRKFAEHYADDPEVYVPKVHWDLVTRHVLVMEFVKGIKVTDVAALEAAGYDRKEVAAIGMRAVLKQIFDHGFFHGDPHPGNIFVLPGPKVCFLDYGSMGLVDEERRDDVFYLLLAVTRKDIDKVIDLFIRVGVLDESKDMRTLRREGQEFLDRHIGIALSQVDPGEVLNDLFDIFAQYEIIVPSDLLQMLRTLTTIDGVGRMLYPDFDPYAVIRPFATRFFLKRLRDPKFVARAAVGAAGEYWQLLTHFPGSARRALDRLARGELAIRTHIHEIERYSDDQRRATNRLAVSFLTGALALGSALLLAQADKTIQWWGTAGAMGATILSVGVLWMIFRSGRL